MTPEQEAELRERAQDLAAVSAVSFEQAHRAIMDVLSGESSAIANFAIGRRVSRWKRLIPGWRYRMQRQILKEHDEAQVGGDTR